ncbi:MAG: hypothetical protein PHC51_04995 [bacterium]|nr:hypothetical protein [bacterium]
MKFLVETNVNKPAAFDADPSGGLSALGNVVVAPEIIADAEAVWTWLKGIEYFGGFCQQEYHFLYKPSEELIEIRRHNYAVVMALTVPAVCIMRLETQDIMSLVDDIDQAIALVELFPNQDMAAPFAYWATSRKDELPDWNTRMKCVQTALSERKLGFGRKETLRGFLASKLGVNQPPSWLFELLWGCHLERDAMLGSFSRIASAIRVIMDRQHAKAVAETYRQMRKQQAA